MKDNQYLIKLFEDLYLLEEQAKNLYADFLKTLSDGEEIKIISEIRNDEVRHMEIVKKLLSMVEK